MKPILCNVLMFPGFYESALSQALDYEEERWLEYQEEEEEEGEFHGVENLADAVFWVADYSGAYTEIARDWVRAFRDKVRESIPKFNCRWESMASPREYNFTTDRVFVYLPRALVTRWHAAMKGNEKFADLVRARFSSRDGFISFYPSTLATWYEKDLNEWDHNQIGTLLDAVLIVAGFDKRKLLEEIESDLYESECFSSAFDNCFTYEALRAKLAEREEA